MPTSSRFAAFIYGRGKPLPYGRPPDIKSSAVRTPQHFPASRENTSFAAKAANITRSARNGHHFPDESRENITATLSRSIPPSVVPSLFPKKNSPALAGEIFLLITYFSAVTTGASGAFFLTDSMPFRQLGLAL